MVEMYLLKQMTAFAKYKTLSEAAKQLNLSQSALSRSMQRMEQFIGVNLFIRKKNSIAPFKEFFSLTSFSCEVTIFA